jgi:hypothetical protein
LFNGIQSESVAAVKGIRLCTRCAEIAEKQLENFEREGARAWRVRAEWSVDAAWERNR